MPDNTRWFEPFGAPQLHGAVAAVRSFRAPLPAFVGGNAAVPSPRSASSSEHASTLLIRVCSKKKDTVCLACRYSLYRIDASRTAYPAILTFVPLCP